MWSLKRYELGGSSRGLESKSRLGPRLRAQSIARVELGGYGGEPVVDMGGRPQWQPNIRLEKSDESGEQ